MIVGGSVTGLSLLQKETYHTLFAGLSMEDASMIVTKLKEQKIPYRLGWEEIRSPFPRTRYTT